MVGLLGIVWACWRLRPEGDPPTKRRMTYATAAMGIAAGLLALGSTGLGQLALLPAVVLAGQVLIRVSENNAWSYATRGWRLTYRVSAVVYGVSILVLVASWLAGGDLLVDPLFALGGGAWVAVPCVLAARAAALSSRDLSQAAAAPVPFWARVGAGPYGALLLGLVLLLPLWLLLPLGLHYAWTPTFPEYARKHPGSWAPEPLAGGTVEATVQDRSWITGRVLGLRIEPDDPPFPAPLQSAAHRIRFTLHRGDVELLHVEEELIGTLDELSGELSGARVRVKPLEPAGGFHARVHTRIDLEGATSGSAASGDLVRRLPFVVYIALVSGPRQSHIITERVKGLPIDTLADIPGVAPVDPPWFLPDLAGLSLLGGESALPPSEKGLRYLAVIQGRLELRQDGVRKQQVSSISRFRANTLEYSYTAQLHETNLVQNSGTVETASRPLRWSNPRRWNGRVW